MRMAQNGAEQGLVIVADKQTAGKGRRGRSWESPKGENLYFSILLKPALEPEKVPAITLVMAYSVAKAIRNHLGMPVGIKWPNDLVLSKKKVCGILTEMHMDGYEIQDVIVGVGINVNMKEFPEELQDKATSLFLEKGEVIQRESLLQAVLDEFGVQLRMFLDNQNLSFLKDSYNELLINREKEVVVLEPSGEYKAKALGINQAGELLVEREDGATEIVYAGEVSVRGIYGYV